MMRSNILARLILCLSACFITGAGWAQGYKEDLLKVTKKMLSVKTYSMVMKYNLYLDNAFQKPYQTRDVSIKRDHNQVFLTQSNGLEVLDNDRFQVVVNTTSKLISARKKDKTENMFEQRLEVFDFMKGNMDTLLKGYEKISLTGEQNGMATYELYYRQPNSIEKCVVCINRKQSILQWVKVYYKDYYNPDKLDDKKHPLMVETIYQGFTEQPVFPQGLFKESNYIMVAANGKISPQKKYAAYKQIFAEDE